MKRAACLFFLLALTFLLRCYNVQQILPPGHVFFVDADCYSRMSRVALILQHPLEIPRYHAFENYPAGTVPHTTVPLDYAIALVAVFLRPFSANAVDLAGALISPLLGVLTAGFIWFWLGQARLPHREIALLLFAGSPILVHATVLGRPDHQSLLVLLLAVALGAEWILSGCSSRRWAVAGGMAWGLALWTSLYEPLILFAAIYMPLFLFRRKQMTSTDRRRGYAFLGGVLLLFLAVEHWRIEAPSEAIRRYFPDWEKTIGELASAAPLSGLFLAWLGLAFVAAPVLLLVAARRDRRAFFVLALLALTFGLTCWQVRWGYFLTLVYVMALPLQFSILPKTYLAWIIFGISLFPILREWDQHLVPEDKTKANEHLAENRELLDASRHLNGGGPILAPWWLSPALAYWSGQPAVAGSSHESLPGVVDAARFFITDNPDEAAHILRERRVTQVVAYDPDRTLSTASTLLSRPAPEEAMAHILYERPHSPPAFLKLKYANEAFKVFGVEEGGSP